MSEDTNPPHSKVLEWPKSCQKGWLQFGEEKFPSYETFWKVFVESRLKSSRYLSFLPNTTFEERQIVKLNYRIFCGFSGIYEYKYLGGENSEWREKGNFSFALHRLFSICGSTELLLFTLLLVTEELDKKHPVHKGYMRRVAARNTKIAAAHQPGRLYSLEDMPSTPPPITILPKEVAVIKEKFDLRTYSFIADQIRYYEKAVSSLSIFKNENWGPLSTGHRHEDYASVADDAALKKILGDYHSMHDLIQDQSDRLIAEINKLWGEQLISLIKRKLPQEETRPFILIPFYY